MLDMVQQRLLSFGYEIKETDTFGLTFCIDKVQNIIKNDCNVSEIPEGLMQIAVDMVCGEFLTAKKTFAPNDLSMLDLGVAVKQLQMGDTNTTFATENSENDEQRLNNFLNYLLSYGRGQFACYRKLQW